MNKTPLYLLVAIALASVATAPRAVMADEAPSVTTAAALDPATPPSAATAEPAVAAEAVPAAPPAPTHAAKKAATAVKNAVKKAVKDLVSPGAGAGTDTSAAAKDDDSTDAAANDADIKGKHGKHGNDNAVVSIGHDSHLASGEHADAVVSVLGSSTSDGEVDDAVVSVLGNTRVTGPVGDSAVAVLGNTYVDSHVGNAVVAVMGNVELGPHADVGDVVAVGGELIRDPAAVIRGTTQHVQLFGNLGGLEWLHSWVHNCLLYARPLAFAPHLGWAWTIALSFLALYLLIALLFPKGVVQCAKTMEAHPGRTVLAALFTFLLKPIVFLLILVTVIGAILIPFLAFALFIAGLFGKAAALAWLGRRVLPRRDGSDEFPPVLAVLIGGVIVLGLYLVPVLGFITYKALGILGLGIVVYTLLLGLRASRAAQAEAAVASAPAAPAAAAAAPAGAAAASAVPGASGAPAEETPDASAAPAPAPAPAHAAAPATVSTAMSNRAGFWIRGLALLLDLILVGIVFAKVHPSMHTVALILATYGAVMWKLKGTTIGGIICGLRVVRLDGRAIDWPTSFARALGCFLSAAVAGLGFIWVVFDAERQSWHDKIAGTVVVHAPRGTPLV